MMIAVLNRTDRQTVDDEPLYEIIDGQRVELPPMSILANRVRSNIHIHLGHHLLSHPVGEAVVETLIHLPLPTDRHRRPDVAFVSSQAIAAAPPQPGSDNAWDIVPELMVEVVSPTDHAEELLDKIAEYFEAGSKLVWVVYPTRRFVYIYESLRSVRILGDDQELDGGAVLPDFRVRIGSLFPTNAIAC